MTHSSESDDLKNLPEEVLSPAITNVEASVFSGTHDNERVELESQSQESGCTCKSREAERREQDGERRDGGEGAGPHGESPHSGRALSSTGNFSNPPLPLSETAIGADTAGKKAVSDFHNGEGWETGLLREEHGARENENVCENPEKEDSVEKDRIAENEDEARGPRGYLQDEVRGTKAELEVIRDVVADAYDSAPPDRRNYRKVGRRLLAHVYYCACLQATRGAGGEELFRGVPISYRLIQKACRDMGCRIPSSTKAVWSPLRARGLLIVQGYFYREGDGPGRSRRFRLSRGLMERLINAAEKGVETETRYNLMTGARIRKARKTKLTYDGTHSWKGRSTPIYRVLKTLKGQRDLVNKRAVEEHLQAKRAKKQNARWQYEMKRAAFFGLLRRCCRRQEGKWVLNDEVGAGTKEAISQARRDAYEAWRAYTRARSRYSQDLQLWVDIKAQGLEPAPDQPSGIYEYTTAYKVQEASGRLTMTCGLQNASKEMKAAAAKGISDYHNYDIKSSQTEALRQEMRDAVEAGADLDPSVLSDYEGKDALTEEYGIARDRWKRPEHSVKFGARFSHESYQKATAFAKRKVIARIGTSEDGTPNFDNLPTLRHEKRMWAWERAVYNALPTMAQVAHDWAKDEEISYDDPEVIYGLLKKIYGEMAEEIGKWRAWLVDGHWRGERKSGSRHGYYVENPCGLAFSIHDEWIEGDSGPSRYEQEAAYVTSRLQGLEAAYIHALARLAEEYDYEFLRNEHDGGVVLGKVPEEARDRARNMSGFRRAQLEEKSFEEERSDEESSSSLYECERKMRNLRSFASDRLPVRLRQNRRGTEPTGTGRRFGRQE